VTRSEIRGADLVREVFARVRAGDLGVADLFREDAVLHYGDIRAEGRDAIRRFYGRTVDALQPQPVVDAILESPPWYVALVDLPTAGPHMRALDLFELDGGCIRSIEIYIRPGGDGG
jgi:hypothetical protein